MGRPLVFSITMRTALILVAFLLVTLGAKCPDNCRCSTNVVKCNCHCREQKFTLSSAVDSSVKKVIIKNCGQVSFEKSLFAGLDMELLEVKKCESVEFHNDTFKGMKNISLVILQGISNLTLGDMEGLSGGTVDISDSVIERLPTYEKKWGKQRVPAIDQMKLTKCTLKQLHSQSFHINPRQLIISECRLGNLVKYAFSNEYDTFSLTKSTIIDIGYMGLYMYDVKDAEIVGNLFVNFTGSSGQSQIGSQKTGRVTFADNVLLSNVARNPSFTGENGVIIIRGNSFPGGIINGPYFNGNEGETIIDGNKFPCDCYISWMWGDEDTYIEETYRVSLVFNTSKCSGPKEMDGVKVRELTRVTLENGTCSHLEAPPPKPSQKSPATPLQGISPIF